MSYTNLKLEIEARVAVLTISHPPANALNQVTLSELRAALDDLEKDDNVKVIVLTGEGRFFIAGADIKEFTQLTQVEAQAASESGQRLFRQIESFSKPIIAAINGGCLGGGLEMALACHIRLAAAEATLGLPELNLGLIPGYGGTQRLPRLIGRGKATQLILTSQLINAGEALQLGLVEAVYPQEQLIAEASKLAAQIAAKGAVSLRLALEAIDVGWNEGNIAGIQREAELFGEAFCSEDMKEGVQAFLEKRKPQFKDR